MTKQRSRELCIKKYKDKQINYSVNVYYSCENKYIYVFRLIAELCKGNKNKLKWQIK